ncbi:MAG: hypothetical protein QME85_10850 [Candidatus Saccharicenans sp.]|nr:hypothetical protein [Candidatus Saccharicenans sp.]
MNNRSYVKTNQKTARPPGPLSADPRRQPGRHKSGARSRKIISCRKDDGRRQYCPEADGYHPGYSSSPFLWSCLR